LSFRNSPKLGSYLSQGGMMSEYDYSLELKKQLEKDVWLRHLFSRVGKQVVVILENDMHISGILKSIEYVKGGINLEVVSDDKDWFLNWKHVMAVRTEKFEEGEK